MQQVCKRKTEGCKFSRKKPGRKLVPRRGEFDSPLFYSLILVVATLNNQNEDMQFPLSFAQKRLWFLNRLEPDSPFYNIPANIRIGGALDLAALLWSVEKIIERHEALRTVFCLKDGEPTQQILERIPIAFPMEDGGSVPSHELDGWIRAHAEEELRRPFDLASGPLLRFRLLRIADRDHVLLTTMHHIVSDAWSMGVFVREFTLLYGERVSGIPCALPDLPIQYADYSEWQHEWLAGERVKQQQDYWRGQLADLPPALDLPLDRSRPRYRGFEGGSVAFEVAPTLVPKLKALCRVSGTTLFMTLLGVLSVLLSKYGRQEDVVVGSPVANRNQSEIESLIGFFVNTLVLRVDLSGDPSFKDVLARVKKSAVEAYDHQDVPFEQVVDAVGPERHLNISPLFQVSFAVQNAPVEEIVLPGLSVCPLTEIETGMGRFDLEFAFWEEGERLHGAIVYKKDIFDASTVERMGRHFQTLLEQAARHPDAKIGMLSMLDEAERRELLALGSRDFRAFSDEPLLHRQFEAIAEKQPDSVALSGEDRHMTYRELNEKANLLAHRLMENGIEPEVLVGLYLKRSIETVVGILAILKAGGAYLPLEAAYQNERLRFMLEDSGVSTIVTLRSLVAEVERFLNGKKCNFLCIDEAGDGESHNPISGTTAENLAYVIYTSGSTGEPKGVEITQRNVTRLFSATRSMFHFDEKDVWTLFHSHAFDFSVWEIWGALLYGGRLVVVPYWVSRSPADFYGLLRTEAVTVLSQTPSSFYQLIQADEEAGTPASLSLRLVIFGGEALDFQKLHPWFSRHGETLPQLVNMFGITETTVHASYRPLRASDAERPGSMIGVPLPDLGFYLLDEHGQPVPMGVKGEIHVGGGGVARGYLNRAELTAERFIVDPFSKTRGKLYKCGDLGRWLPDGDLEYCGRMDDQVQIRGFRVELGEIGAVLSDSPFVRNAVVLYRKREKGHDLAAYIVPTGSIEEFPASALRKYLKEKLPDYMIPGQMFTLTSLPLTAHGKIDRKTLLKMEQRALIEAKALPATATETVLSQIWGEVLGLVEVGIHDNFFELGGHSLIATQVASRTQQAFGINLPLREIFEKPTISELATLVEELQLQQALEMDSDLLDSFLAEES